MKIINNVLFSNEIFENTEEKKPIAINLHKVDAFSCTTAYLSNTEKDVVQVSTSTEDYMIDEEPIEFFKKLQEYERKQE